MVDRSVGFEATQDRDLNTSRLANTRQIVTEQVDNHDILGAVLATGQEVRFQNGIHPGIVDTAARALDGAGLGTCSIVAREPFRGTRADRDLAKIQVGSERRGVVAPENLIEREGIKTRWQRSRKSLRNVRLKYISGQNVFDSTADRILVFEPGEIRAELIDGGRFGRMAGFAFRQKLQRFVQALTGSCETSHFIGFRVSSRYDEGMLLIEIERNDDVINLKLQRRHSGRGYPRCELGFKQAPEFIGDVTGQATLKRRQTLDVVESVPCERSFDIRKRRGICGENRSNRIEGEIRVAAERVMGHGAVQEGQPAPAAQSARDKNRVLEGDFLPDRLVVSSRNMLHDDKLAEARAACILNLCGAPSWRNWVSMSDESMAVAEVLLPLALPGPYSYTIPHGLSVEPGAYAIVPLGSRSVIGVVWAIGSKGPNEISLRPLVEVLDAPPMPALHRKFVDWVAAYYVEPAGNILRMVLRVPSALAPAREQFGYQATGRIPGRMTPQRQRVLNVAADGPILKARELAEMAGVGASVVKGMVKDGSLVPRPLPVFRPFPEPDVTFGQLTLSPAQETAARELCAIVARRQSSVALLDGVTGSGKTEVYFEAMAAALAQGSQVLLMLPEIALTGSFLAKVERRFGVEPAHWHSDVRPRERERVWRGVAEGSARIVVGARSALFLPWKSPGLFVIDEEHEAAYKQEDGVAYHARDMAVVYGSLGKFPVILSSATPSLESLVNAERGRYSHIRLERRHNESELPATSLIDMRTAPIAPQNWLSDELVEEVSRSLTAGDQALLFLNRRGYAPLTLCRACGHHLSCPNCSTSLVEHRFRKQLQCHHCGHQEPMPHACPKCGVEGKLVPCGPGIERLSEEAARRFPEARIVILSSDLARGVFLKDALIGIERGEYNLIIGTQLVAKGHHFPHLVTVGVVDADLALESGDPRSGERTWQLMAQVAGRSGRGEKPGQALIQTHMPGHPLMNALKRGDREGFLAQEMRVREESGLPPYRRLAAIIVSGVDASETERLAREMWSVAPAAADVQILGPAPAPIHLVRGRYRWRYLIRAERDVNVQAFIRQWLTGIKTRGSLRIDIDVDPYNFL